MTQVAIAIFAGLAIIAGAFTYVSLRLLRTLEDLGRDALLRMNALHEYEESEEPYEEYPAGVYRVDAQTVVSLENERIQVRPQALHNPYVGLGAEIEELVRHNG